MEGPLRAISARACQVSTRHKHYYTPQAQLRVNPQNPLSLLQGAQQGGRTYSQNQGFTTAAAPNMPRQGSTVHPTHHPTKLWLYHRGPVTHDANKAIWANQ